MDLIIQTKFSFEDKIWFMHFGKPTWDTVTAIRIEQGIGGPVLSYRITDECGDTYYIKEEFLYRTKKELLANQ